MEDLLKTLNTIKTAIITEVKLEIFILREIFALISDTLHFYSMELFAIAKLIYEKTKGNPLFIKQFLSSLYEEKTIYFNSDE